MASDFFNQKIAPVKKLKRKLAGIGGSLTRKLRDEIGRRKMDTNQRLRRSLKHKTFFKSGFTGVKIRVTMEGYGGFLNKNLYAKSPKMPNLTAIMEWMVDKGIKPRDGYSLKQSAYFIAKAISEKGYIVYNGYRRGWVDFVYSEAQKKMGKKITKDVALCMKEIDDMEFKFLKLKK
jgi:hypothetical protein